MSLYSNENDENRMKMVIKFDQLIKDINISKNIEKSIYNYVIEVSKNRDIVRSWKNKVFYNLYINKCLSIYINLNKGSYIKNDYLFDRVKSNKIDAKKYSKIISI